MAWRPIALLLFVWVVFTDGMGLRKPRGHRKACKHAKHAKGKKSKAALLGSNASQHLLPFDCYVDNGEDYNGLLDHGESGRACKNWLKQDKYAPNVKGLGNHNYCRNPKGEKEKPWCYTVDPEVEFELCEVRECENGGEPLEPWTAPEGAKSEDAEAEGPCEYEPPDDAGFKEYKAGRACMDHRGDTWWLITGKNYTVDDTEGCKKECSEFPGTQFFTFWESGDNGNCGCYRKCVLVDEDLTVNSPTVYKVD